MKLYYDQPARNWHESLPLGNGRLGATVYGGTKKETLALNEDTLWSGYPEKTQKELPEGYLVKVRELTEKREYQKALEYLENCFKTSEDVQMYIPFGNLCMEMLEEEEGPTDAFVAAVNKNISQWLVEHIQGWDKAVAEYIRTK